MSTTGSGRDTSQHQNRETSTTKPQATPSRNWNQLLAAYPTAPGDIHATPTPDWDEPALTDQVRTIHPRGRERALARFELQRLDTLQTDAALEGFAFTVPELRTLLRGEHVPGHTAGEELQVAALHKASNHLIDLIRTSKTYEPTQDLSDTMHIFIAAPLGVRSIAFRGDQRDQYAGPIVTLGRGRTFRALDARLTHAALDDGLERINSMLHPVLRGATWAAFATYHQFYFDGNKRTSRYVMNATLMSHGYDAILIPNARKTEYVDAVIAAYEHGDLTPHIEFLLSCYDDSHK